MSFLWGVEIEMACLNSVPIGEYRSPKMITPNWATKADSSIRSMSGWCRGEIINPQPFTIKEPAQISTQVRAKMEEVFEWLSQKHHRKANLHKDFTKWLDFNRSMGAHIHFSRSDEEGYRVRDSPTQYIAAKDAVFKRLKREEPAHKFRLFAKHYYRVDYSSRMKLRELYSARREFYETNNKGTEWRAFNFMGCTTWNDVIRRTTIAIEEIYRATITEPRHKARRVCNYSIDDSKALKASKFQLSAINGSTLRVAAKDIFQNKLRDVAAIDKTKRNDGDSIPMKTIVKPSLKLPTRYIRVPAQYRWIPGLRHSQVTNNYSGVF